MKKRIIKKYLLGLGLIGIAVIPMIFLSSCSGANYSQTPPKIILEKTGTNTFLTGYSLFPTPKGKPIFYKDDKEVDPKENLTIDRYWANILGPAYSLAITAIDIDAKTNHSNYLSEGIVDRDPSWNYVISNAWNSGAPIYNNSTLKFKTSPYKMRMVLNGDIPKIEKDDLITDINQKATVSISGIELDFSYFDITNGSKTDLANAKKFIRDFYKDTLPKDTVLKDNYTIKFNFYSEVIYEVVKSDDDKVLIEIGQKFDPKTMKVKTTTNYHMGNSASGTKFEIKDALENFSKWLKEVNPVIASDYKNFINGIQGSAVI
ncbi:MAG: hypothetical protein ACRCVI_01575 [Mycoplasmoidaceae bacterium]